jgi:ABC-type molybdate transport system substrate-binding protein
MQAKTAAAASLDQALLYEDFTPEAARNEVESESSSSGSLLDGRL